MSTFEEKQNQTLSEEQKVHLDEYWKKLDELKKEESELISKMCERRTKKRKERMAEIEKELEQLDNDFYEYIDEIGFDVNFKMYNDETAWYLFRDAIIEEKKARNTNWFKTLV